MTPNPCYIIEEDLLRRNLSHIKDVATRANVEIILAFKAFALWKTFPIFREYISHTTASSPYEARLAFEEFGSYAHSYSPAYTEENFPEFMRCSSHITFNSFSQFQRFYPETLKADHEISCGIRVNPEYSEIETDLYNPCAPGSRFGVTADQMEAIFPEISKRLNAQFPKRPNNQSPKRLNFGFHCHCHCEDDSYTLERTLKHLEEKFGKWFPQLEWLNLGGGHLMTRKDYDVEHLISVLNGLHERYPNLRIILEPGSAFAWQTGPLVSKVVDIVSSPCGGVGGGCIKTAILNVSFACHMPDCLEMPYQPAVRGAEIVKNEEEPSTNSTEPLAINHQPSASLNERTQYRLGGNSCLSGDFIGSWQFDHELHIGEEIIFEDMIHYTTVKTHMFNGISHPAIAMKHTDGTVEVLREFHYEDYKNRMD